MASRLAQSFADDHAGADDGAAVAGAFYAETLVVFVAYKVDVHAAAAVYTVDP